jgi:hypothetical protein
MGLYWPPETKTVEWIIYMSSTKWGFFGLFILMLVSMVGKYYPRHLLEKVDEMGETHLLCVIVDVVTSHSLAWGVSHGHPLQVSLYTMQLFTVATSLSL